MAWQPYPGVTPQSQHPWVGWHFPGQQPGTEKRACGPADTAAPCWVARADLPAARGRYRCARLCVHHVCQTGTAGRCWAAQPAEPPPAPSPGGEGFSAEQNSSSQAPVAQPGSIWGCRAARCVRRISPPCSTSGKTPGPQCCAWLCLGGGCGCFSRPPAALPSCPGSWQAPGVGRDRAGWRCRKFCLQNSRLRSRAVPGTGMAGGGWAAPGCAP